MLHAGRSAHRVLAVAHGFARESSVDLAPFVATSDARDTPLAAMIERWLEDQGADARIIALPDSTPENVATLVAQTGARVLVWPANGNLEMAAEVEPLLRAVSCPLIVMR